MSHVDAMILDYLAAAIDNGAQELEEPLRAEGTAALRLFFWSELAVGETAVQQSERTPDSKVRERLDRLVGHLLHEYRVPPDERGALHERADELNAIHGDLEDCRIVAEAELSGSTLVTFDKKLRNRLRSVARVQILFPTELWALLAIPRGTPPRWRPHPTNPLARERFWRWD